VVAQDLASAVVTLLKCQNHAIIAAAQVIIITESKKMTQETKHLWEIEHPYYCNEGNYFASEKVGTDYRTFSEFLEAEGSQDEDLNLIFRWDWQEGEDHELPTYNGDNYYRNGRLMLFYMGQRKGLYRYVSVEVCRADEPAVIEFLKPRWEHMKLLWEGISDDPRN
jgi:hypothetical protein